MKRMKSVLTRALTLTVLGVLSLAVPASAQTVRDVVTVGSVTGHGVVDVPVYIRDTSGSALGIDQAFGSRIQAYSLRVSYSPTSAVQSVTFARAGITAPLTPQFESTPSAPGMASLLDSFDETTNLIPFTSNAALPGNQVAHLLVTIAPGTAPGTHITLTLDPVLTELTNEAGTTLENVGNGRLQLVAGAITVDSTTVPTVTEWGLGLLAIALAVVALRMRLS